MIGFPFAVPLFPAGEIRHVYRLVSVRISFARVNPPTNTGSSPGNLTQRILICRLVSVRISFSRGEPPQQIQAASSPLNTTPFAAPLFRAGGNKTGFIYILKCIYIYIYIYIVYISLSIHMYIYIYIYAPT